MNTNKRRLKKSISDFLFKTLIVGIITLVLMITMKTNANFKTNFYKYVYDTNLSYSKFTNFFNKYFKDLKKEESVTVSNEEVAYEKKEKHYDGAKLTVGSNYNVQAKESGIVVFIGEKEHYGNVMIIQQIDGIDVWYGNISDINYSMYDYVKKGDILGISNDYLYLLYKQNGKVLDYEKYI